MIVAQPINANQCQCLKASFLGRPDPPGDAGVRSVGPYVENLAMLQSLRGDASASDLPKNQAPLSTRDDFEVAGSSKWDKLLNLLNLLNNAKIQTITFTLFSKFSMNKSNSQ